MIDDSSRSSIIFLGQNYNHFIFDRAPLLWQNVKIHKFYKSLTWGLQFPLDSRSEVLDCKFSLTTNMWYALAFWLKMVLITSINVEYTSIIHPLELTCTTMDIWLLLPQVHLLSSPYFTCVVSITIGKILNNRFKILAFLSVLDFSFHSLVGLCPSTVVDILHWLIILKSWVFKALRFQILKSTFLFTIVSLFKFLKN